MGREKVVDYTRQMRDFDKAMGRKPEDTELPINDPVVPDGGVDYMKASQDYERYQIEDESEVIRSGKG